MIWIVLSLVMLFAARRTPSLRTPGQLLKPVASFPFEVAAARKTDNDNSSCPCRSASLMCGFSDGRVRVVRSRELPISRDS